MSSTPRPFKFCPNIYVCADIEWRVDPCHLSDFAPNSICAAYAVKEIGEEVDEPVEMDQLSNAFSLLELDVEDARHQITVPAAAGDENREIRDGDKREDNGLDDATLLKNENGDKETSGLILGNYKMPLVWIDLEMTGEF
ncbi:hypothetical protein CDL12_04163 [Handroanthus impetiginosus]|uniref:Exonuclease domain-containing protein n=1 Tax=Handroanthus impetiginosus TaxID=429701 RepID=A0A2G9I038_9LAMI|nr:hypothetical protein CDL12_04163 [Handroanthus impetiginosus]